MFVSRAAFGEDPTAGDSGMAFGRHAVAGASHAARPAGTAPDTYSDPLAASSHTGASVISALDDSGGWAAGSDRSAALERQRALAASKARERMTGGAMMPPSSGGGMASPVPLGLATGGLGASGRNIARGAPVTGGMMMPAPLSPMGSASGAPSLGAALAARTGGMTGGPGFSTLSSGGGASSSLAEAIRERERRAKEGGVVAERAPETAVDRDLAQRGVAATFDPSMPSSTASTSSAAGGAAAAAGGLRTAVSATATTLPPSAGPDDDGPGDPSGKPGFSPVAPMGGAVTARGGARSGAAAAILDASDPRSFCVLPTPRPAGLVHCVIERERLGLTGRMYPTYCLYLEEPRRFLMASRKRGSNKTSNYLFCMDKRDMERESASYLGKLRANFVGTEFVCYDDGAAPEKRGEAAALRQEMCAMTYASNVLASRGPRKMKVAVPKVGPDGRRIVFQPDRDEDSMLAKFKAGYVQEMVTLINKPPKWNDQVGAYVLNFNGRVTMASVKNFQLVSAEDQETVLLQFGRTGKDTFTMDYQWPLCPLQAFAICVSSFDWKLACE